MTTTYVQATDWPYMDRDGHSIIVTDTARVALVKAGWTPPQPETVENGEIKPC